MRHVLACLVCGTLGLGLGLPAQAYHLPKWELGIGLAALRLPAYRGAKGSQDFALPFPYVAYRGERLRVDEEGIRGQLLERKRYRVDFSLAGNVPVRDDEVGARSGMPGLDPVGEVGPTLDWRLWERDEAGWPKRQLWLRLPVRAVLSVGDPLLAHRGWVFSPSLDAVYQRGSADLVQRWSLSLGPLFATREYHQYFYAVAPSYVTASRPFYTPGGGYSGSRVTLALTLHKQRWWFGGFARYDHLGGAVFVDSPLVETRRYFAVGLAVSRIFATSGTGKAHP